MCQASKYAALLSVSVLSKAFVLHGTPSCLLITHKLAEIWFYSSVISPSTRTKRGKYFKAIYTTNFSYVLWSREVFHFILTNVLTRAAFAG